MLLSHARLTSEGARHVARRRLLQEKRLVATIQFARLNKKFSLRYKVYDKRSDVKDSVISTSQQRELDREEKSGSA
jgi:hypothetical protein